MAGNQSPQNPHELKSAPKNEPKDIQGHIKAITLSLDAFFGKNKTPGLVGLGASELVLKKILPASIEAYLRGDTAKGEHFLAERTTETGEKNTLKKADANFIKEVIEEYVKSNQEKITKILTTEREAKERTAELAVLLKGGKLTKEARQLLVGSGMDVEDMSNLAKNPDELLKTIKEIKEKKNAPKKDTSGKDGATIGSDQEEPAEKPENIVQPATSSIDSSPAPEPTTDPLEEATVATVEKKWGKAEKEAWKKLEDQLTIVTKKLNSKTKPSVEQKKLLTTEEKRIKDEMASLEALKPQTLIALEAKIEALSKEMKGKKGAAKKMLQEEQATLLTQIERFGERREIKGEEALEILKETLSKEIPELVIHGGDETPEGKMKILPDMDGLAGTMLFDIAGVEYKKLTLVPKGESIDGSVMIDSGGHPGLVVVLDGEGKSTIFIDNHGDFSGGPASSAAVTYKSLLEIGLLTEEKMQNAGWSKAALEQFIQFINQIDSLTYPITRKSFKSTWANTLYGVKKLTPQQIPFSWIQKRFKEGKSPEVPFTKAELEEVMSRRMVKQSDGTSIEEVTTLGDLCAKQQERVWNSINGEKKALNRMMAGLSKPETPETGNIVISLHQKKTGPRGEYMAGDIPLGSEAAWALGNDSYLSFNEEEQFLFFSKPTGDIEPVLQKLQTIFPNAELVRGSMIIVKTKKGEKITSKKTIDDVLKAMDLKAPNKQAHIAAWQEYIQKEITKITEEETRIPKNIESLRDTYKKTIKAEIETDLTDTDDAKKMRQQFIKANEILSGLAVKKENLQKDFNNFEIKKAKLAEAEKEQQITALKKEWEEIGSQIEANNKIIEEADAELEAIEKELAELDAVEIDDSTATNSPDLSAKTNPTSIVDASEKEPGIFIDEITEPVSIHSSPTPLTPSVSPETTTIESKPTASDTKRKEIEEKRLSHLQIVSRVTRLPGESDEDFYTRVDKYTQLQIEKGTEEGKKYAEINEKYAAELAALENKEWGDPLLDMSALERMEKVASKIGEKSFMQMVVKMYIDQSVKTIKDLSEKIENEDYTGLAKITEKEGWQGSSMNVGATQLIKKIEEFRKILETKNQAALASKLEEIKFFYVQTIGALQEYLSALEKREGGASKV